MKQPKTKLELLEDVNKYASIVDEIKSVSNRVIKDDDEKELFNSIVKNIDKWKERLVDKRFKVALIGTTSAGKSTFANALLKEDLLPEDEATCTYTSASIEYGNEDMARVVFYSKDEFIIKFNLLLKEIEFNIEDYNNITISSLVEFLTNKSAIIKESQTVKEIKAIINDKNDIEKYLNNDNKILKNNLKTEIREYITNPKIARAVKSINIKSPNFENMENIIIYDVPGFDSATKLHLEQAKKHMMDSEIIILVHSLVGATDLNGEQINILMNTKDEYGTQLSRKMMVAGTKFDFRVKNSEEESKKNVKKIIDDLKNSLIEYGVYQKENLFEVSPLGYLEKIGKVNTSEAYPSLEKFGFDDNIEIFKERLEEIFKTDALEVLNDVVTKDLNEMDSFLISFKQKHNVSQNEEKLKKDLLAVQKKYKKVTKEKLLNLVIKQKEEIENQKDFNINHDLKDEIKIKWIEKLSISDEQREKDIKQIEEDGVSKPTEYNRNTRKRIYNKSLEIITQLTSDILIKKDKKIIDNFKNDIYSIFDINNNESMKEILNNEFEKIMAIHSYNEKSYKPLLIRFLNDIFKVLIGYAITSNKEGERIEAFTRVKNNIIALFPYDKENFKKEMEIGTYEKILVKKILVQYEELSIELIKEQLNSMKTKFSEKISIESLAEEIKNTNISYKSFIKSMNESENKFKNMGKDGVISLINSTKPKNSLELLLTYANEATTYEDVQKEINKDLEILEDIISNVLLNAMMIEKPFLDSLNTQVEAIRRDLNDEDSALNDFMHLNIEILDRENYNSISGDPELNKKISNIITQIENR